MVAVVQILFRRPDMEDNGKGCKFWGSGAGEVNNKYFSMWKCEVHEGIMKNTHTGTKCS